MRSALLVVTLLAGCIAPGPSPDEPSGGAVPPDGVDEGARAPRTRNVSAPFVPLHGNVSLVLVREAYVVDGGGLEDRVSGHCSYAYFDGETFTVQARGAPPAAILFRDVDVEGRVLAAGSSPVALHSALPARWTLTSPFDRHQPFATVVSEDGRVEIDAEEVPVGASLTRAVDHTVATPEGNASVRGNLTVTNVGLVPIRTSEPQQCE